jgi:uncharacterized protein YndB with AHSA1/START domain
MFAAPRDVVFRFWTEPTLLAQWWGPEDFHTPTDSVVVDGKQGGRFELAMVQDDGGAEFRIRAEIVDIVEPELLTIRFEAIPEVGIPSVTTRVQFHDHGDRTRITLHEGPTPADAMDENTLTGWAQSFDKLDKVLPGSTPGSG